METRLTALARLRQTRVAAAQTDVVAKQTRTLARLRGIGLNGAMTLSTELFAWRGFTNGRQIGASVGLTPGDDRLSTEGIEH